MLQAFSIDLGSDERGLLWGYWQIFQAKASGILSLRSISSSKTELRKELAVVRGEVFGIRSNWPQDSLRSFSTHHLEAGEEGLAKVWADLPSGVGLDAFAQEVLKQQILDTQQIQAFLQRYFRHRLFHQLTLRRGQLEFKPLPELDESKVQAEVVRLGGQFEKALWVEILNRFDDGYCRSRFSKHVTHSFKVKTEFPLPLAPQELREWNQLQGKELKVAQLQGIGLQLVTAAQEFGLIHWESSSSSDWEKLLLKTQKDFQGADAFKILGVSEDTSLAEVKTKYLEYIKKFHPDRLPPELPSELREVAEQIIAQVNEAFSVVSDPQKREEFVAEKELEKQGGMEGIERKLKAELAFDEARLALRRRHFSRALDLLDNVYGFMSEDLEFMVERAYAHMMVDIESKKADPSKYPGFHKIFDHSIKMRPDYTNSFYYKGLLLKLEGHLDQALVYFDQAVNLDDGFQEALSEARVIRMRKNKEKDKSKSWFRKKS